MRSKTTAAIWTATLVLALAGPALAQETAEDAAEAGAKAWLGLVDQGSYGPSWEAAAKLFKSALSQEKWTEAVKAARTPLGKLVSRKVKSRQFAKTLPGAPDGEYVVIQYDSAFENKKEAVETVVPMKDPDGVWRVSGYFVK
jgi:predicted transcriptional regulator